MLTVKRIVECATPILSIHICHLPERVDKYNQVTVNLIAQAQAWGNIEILVNSAPRGSITTGAKRNLMMGASHGRYSCAVDDDDDVTPHYCEAILRAIAAEQPDCVGIVGLLVCPGKETWSFRHSITCKDWSKDKARHIYFRPPNHLNPIKTELCRLCQFEDITIGEDRRFSDIIKHHTKTEVFIEEPIYIYTPS